MGFFQIDSSTRLYYEIHGDGDEYIVFLNGLVQTTDAWFFQRDYLKKKYKLLLYDMRCQGRSTKEDKPFHFSIQVDDLKLLLDHLNISRVHVAGSSYGSFIAKSFAIKYPQMVNTLILIAPIREVDFIQKQIYSICFNLLDSGSLQDFFAMLMFVSYSKVREQRFEKDFAIFYKGFSVHSTAQAVRYLLDSFDPDKDFSDYTKIKVPTLVIGAKKDLLHNPADGARIQSEIKNSQLKMIDSGHIITFEQPDIVNQTIADFLK
jgi:pimeloyl-ACP methyl ester carboxylesterase